MTGGKRRRKRTSHSSKRLFAIALTAIASIVLGYIALSSSTPHALTTAPKDGNVQATGLDVGNLAPNFQLTDTGGTTFSRASLAGKPVFIFFTATWCVPCQLGAKELLKYYNETGRNAFNVVIVFVDPSSDTNAAIIKWNKDFGSNSWFTAFDASGMANVYQVKYLDTKYVLDKDGMIAWKDFYPLNYETSRQVLQPLIG